MYLNCSSIRHCLYFDDFNTFHVLGQKFVKFFGGFLENLKNQKDILKLSDLLKTQSRFFFLVAVTVGLNQFWRNISILISLLFYMVWIFLKKISWNRKIVKIKTTLLQNSFHPIAVAVHWHFLERCRRSYVPSLTPHTMESNILSFYIFDLIFKYLFDL